MSKKEEEQIDQLITNFQFAFEELMEAAFKDKRQHDLITPLATIDIAGTEYQIQLSFMTSKEYLMNPGVVSHCNGIGYDKRDVN